MRARHLLVLLWATGCGFSGGTKSSQTADADPGAPDSGGGGGSSDSGSCPDADMDTICDAVDQCPGMDDRIDIDADGIPDCKDDWLCGPTKPSGISQPYIFISGDQWSADKEKFDNVTTTVATVPAGMPIAIKMDWYIRVNCGGQAQSCNAQLEIGFDTIGRDRCLFDGTVQDNQIENGSTSDSLTIAPTPAGASQAYDLRLHIGKRTACGTAGWDGPAPGSSSTIAKICVVK